MRPNQANYPLNQVYQEIDELNVKVTYLRNLLGALRNSLVKIEDDYDSLRQTTLRLQYTLEHLHPEVSGWNGLVLQVPKVREYTTEEIHQRVEKYK